MPNALEKIQKKNKEMGVKSATPGNVSEINETSGSQMFKWHKHPHLAIRHSLFHLKRRSKDLKWASSLGFSKMYPSPPLVFLKAFYIQIKAFQTNFRGVGIPLVHPSSNGGGIELSTTSSAAGTKLRKALGQSHTLLPSPGFPAMCCDSFHLMKGGNLLW